MELSHAPIIIMFDLMILVHTLNILQENLCLLLAHAHQTM